MPGPEDVDHQNKLPEGQPDQIEGQQPGHIEVAYQGEDAQASEGTVEPAGVEQATPDGVSGPETSSDQLEDPNQIHDEFKLVLDLDKAWDMASASDEVRAGAASDRRFVKKYAEVGRPDHPDVGRILEGVESNERYAEALEDWTGILHDHPISEAYRKTHEEVDFSPRALHRVDMDTRRTVEDAQRLEEVLKTLPPSIGVLGVESRVLAELRLYPGSWLTSSKIVAEAYPVDAEPGQSKDEQTDTNITKQEEWERTTK